MQLQLNVRGSTCVVPAAAASMCQVRLMGPLPPSLYPSLAYLVLPSLAAAVSECQLVWQRLDLMLVGRVKRKMMQITRWRNTFPSSAVQNVKMESLQSWRRGGGEVVLHEGGWTTVFVVGCKKLFKLFRAAQTRLEKIKSKRFSYRSSWLAN